MKLQYFKQLFHTLRHKAQQQSALRYAITCAISTSIAASLEHFCGLLPEFATFFIISAVLAVYFIDGDNLAAQSFMIMVGIIITALASSLCLILNPYPILLLGFFGLVSFLFYYYCSLNISTFFFSKYSIVIISFTLVPLASTVFHNTTEIFLLILAGGTIALFTNALVYFLIPPYNLKNIEQLWLCEVNVLLVKLQNDILHTNTQYFQQLTTLFKTRLAENYLELSMVIDRISMALIHISERLQKNPELPQNFSMELMNLFHGISEAMNKQDANIVFSEYDIFRDKIFKLRQQNYFAKLPITTRIQQTELLFLIDKLMHNIMYLTDTNKADPSKEKISCLPPSEKFKIWLRQLLNKIAENTQLQFNDNAKIGIRAAITFSIALLCARFSSLQYAPWIILSCNLVLLVRQGDTVKKGLDRILGHLVGYIIVIFLGLYIWPYSFSPVLWLFPLILCAAYFLLTNYFIYSMLLTILIVYWAFVNTAGEMSASSLVNFANWRLFDVTIGSLIAMIAGITIFPNVGLQSLSKSIKKVFIDINNYLDMLKVQPQSPIDEIKIASLQNSLYQNFNQVTEIFRSIQYQPKRFQHNINKTQKIVSHLESLLGRISGLTRRLHNAYPFIAANPQLITVINNGLEYLQQSVQFCLDPSAHSITRHDLSFVKNTELIYQLNDHHHIGYDELINSIGTLLLLEEIEDCLRMLEEEICQ